MKTLVLIFNGPRSEEAKSRLGRHVRVIEWAYWLIRFAAAFASWHGHRSV